MVLVMMFREPFKWAVLPVLYGTVALLVFVVPPILFERFAEPILGYVEVIGYLSGLLLISALALVMLCRGIARLEHLRSPGILDHLRHCALLYISLGPLASVVVSTYNSPSCCTQTMLAVILSLALVYAAGLDAIMLYFMARRARP
jgi:hypothetical protein